MIRRIASGAVLATLVAANAAIAGDPAVPRTPIGPRVQELRPPPQFPLSEGSQPLPEDRIRISNVGNQMLYIAYWDGDSAWKQAAIDAGRSMEVSCPKCAGTITVAFHDGKENKSVKTKGGGTYYLGWSAQAGAWVLSSSAPAR